MSEEEAQQEPDMTNRLGDVRRINIVAFIKKKHMTFPEFAEIIGVSQQTVRNSFGNSKRRTAPSEKTMKQIYKAFEEIKKDALDKVDYSPHDKGVPSVLANKPAIIPQEIFIQVGRLKTPVSEEMAKKVLIMIALEDLE